MISYLEQVCRFLNRGCTLLRKNINSSFSLITREIKFKKLWALIVWGFIKKHLSCHNSQITEQPCIGAQTNTQRQTHTRAQRWKTCKNSKLSVKKYILDIYNNKWFFTYIQNPPTLQQNYYKPQIIRVWHRNLCHTLVGRRWIPHLTCKRIKIIFPPRKEKWKKKQDQRN